MKKGIHPENYRPVDTAGRVDKFMSRYGNRKK